MWWNWIGILYEICKRPFPLTSTSQSTSTGISQMGKGNVKRIRRRSTLMLLSINVYRKKGAKIRLRHNSNWILNRGAQHGVSASKLRPFSFGMQNSRGELGLIRALKGWIPLAASTSASKWRLLHCRFRQPRRPFTPRTEQTFITIIAGET